MTQLLSMPILSRVATSLSRIIITSFNLMPFSSILSTLFSTFYFTFFIIISFFTFATGCLPKGIDLNLRGIDAKE